MPLGLVDRSPDPLERFAEIDGASQGRESIDHRGVPVGRQADRCRAESEQGVVIARRRHGRVRPEDEPDRQGRVWADMEQRFCVDGTARGWEVASARRLAPICRPWR